MAKIGTAHIEIKPVLSEDALDDLCRRIEDAVAEGVKRGMAKPEMVLTVGPMDIDPERVARQLRVTCGPFTAAT